MSILADLTIKAITSAIFAFIILGTVLAAFGINILDLIFNPEYLHEMQHQVRCESNRGTSLACVAPDAARSSEISATGVSRKSLLPPVLGGENGVWPLVTVSAVNQHLNRGMV